ncbi:hypothetical protein TFLX_06078 [Thermoflexales bacterium]|nr:hypothetical protein TFLX_06078 [Thermoflexales bacterium]
MTTIASSRKRSGGKSPFLWLVVVVLLLAAMLSVLFQQVRQIPLPGNRGSVGVRYNAHAEDEHPEAHTVRKACEQRTEFLYKYLYESGKYAFICRLPDDKWGMMIIKKAQDFWEEVTSFIPKDGSKWAVQQYVEKFATPFKGLLP